MARPPQRRERRRPASGARGPARPGPAAEPRTGAAPDGPMVLYGRNAVHEALRGPRSVRQLWATERAAREPWLGGAAVPVRTADGEELERRCGSPDHQGICAEVDAYRYADAAALLAREDALIVALDEIQDPQNLGAICRTAECAGATGVVIPERRSAEVTPAVCKASAGAVEHLAIARVRNLADFLLEASRVGAWSYGADGDARVRLHAARLPRQGRARDGLRGQRPAPARREIVRRADRAAAARPHRLAQRERRGRRAAVRDHPPARLILQPLSPSGRRKRATCGRTSQLPLDTGSITWQAAAFIRVDLSLRLISSASYT